MQQTNQYAQKTANKSIPVELFVVNEMGSPVLARLIEEVKNGDCIPSVYSYDRDHNRHNRS